MNNFIIVRRTVYLFLFLFFNLAIDSHSAEKKPVPPLTMQEIANATLYINTGGEVDKQKIKLKNGHYEKRAEGNSSLSVDLTKWVQFGDLNSDGAVDAVVIYVWTRGGEEIFYELAVLLNKKGKPVHISSADLGDRVVIQALEVLADTVFLNMLTRGKDDANCCPTLPVKLKYILRAGKLIQHTRVQE